MYVIPPSLAPLAAWRQFVLVRIAPKYSDDGQLVPGKTQKYSTWPYQQPTQALNKRTGETYIVNFGDNFDAHNPTCWLDYDTARTLAAGMPVTGDTIGWGIGFTITDNDPFVCLDLDECATLTGGWTEHAVSMLQRLPGACEVSQSGRGLHIWGWYTGAPPAHGKRCKSHAMELYTERRFIAFGSTATGEMRDLTPWLPSLIAEFFPSFGADADGDDTDGWTTGPVAEHTVLTDDELIHKAMARERKQDPSLVFGKGVFLPSFADLWKRDVAALARCFPPDGPGKEFGYSEADFTLAKELAYWTGKDCERIERLMRGSLLYRDKWEDHRAGYGSLLRMNIIRAVRSTERVYYKPPVISPASTGAAPVAGGKLTPVLMPTNTYIAREELATMFAGCVYVQDRNAILIPNGDIVDQARFNAKFGGYAYGMDEACQKSTKSAWDAFLNNSVMRFPRVDGTEFNPRLEFQQVVERAGRTWVNVYTPPVVDRKPGDVGPFMDLLHRILPQGDDALILLSYMAAVVQYPGIKFRWAPFIQGTRGNGKSTLIECLKHALGWRYYFTLKAGMIENGFNAWLENHILYIADDIYASRDRTDMMEALKSLITGRDHAITLKGIDSIQKRIVGNFIFMDNHRDAMRRQADSRDLCTLYCAQQSIGDRKRDGLTDAFFKGFHDYLEAGGYQAVAEKLHTMEIDPRYNPAKGCQEAPRTSAFERAIEDGRTSLEHEVMELIELEEPGFCGNFVSFHMLKRHLENDGIHRKSATPLKVQELMLRLGYEMHPALSRGRLPVHVYPDNTKPILYVKRDTVQAAQTNPDVIAALYTSAQQSAMTAQTARKLGGIAA